MSGLFQAELWEELDPSDPLNLRYCEDLDCPQRGACMKQEQGPDALCLTAKGGEGTGAGVLAGCVGKATLQAFSSVEDLQDLKNRLLRGAVLFMELVDIIERWETKFKSGG